MEMKKYYIGDLCYVLDDTTYHELFDLVDGDPLNKGKFVTLKDGRKFFIGGTAHGDGGYFGSDGEQYGVDSGTIGIVAVEDIYLEKKFNQRIPDEFPSPRAGKLYHEGISQIYMMPIDSFERSSSNNGKFQLGKISINTR
tara:strand:+ start:65 stop:484 length:420 start_codon:yes stop_codon:yes gene_type:complete